MDEERLVRLVAKGDRAAFEELYRRTSPWLAVRLRFRELLQELGTDTCVLVSTHLVEDVAAACTDVVLFAEGRLVFQGTPDDLAAAGGPEHMGDSPLERGCSALLQGPGPGRGAW